MNACIINEIQTYYIHHVVIAMLCMGVSFTAIHKSSTVASWDCKVSI